MHPRLVDLVRQHRSTIIFVNARRLAERLASRLNELWAADESAGGTAPARGSAGRTLTATAGEAIGTSPAEEGHELVKAHHGSLSRERRLLIEDELKRGTLRGLVATSSLELGIDMGAVDLVVQVESPGAVSRGLQRVGRAGHQVGEPSRGKIFPKHRSDLLEAAVVVEGMLHGRIEATRYPRNPLDVAAQQLVAMTAMDDWTVPDLAAVLRGAANFAELSDEQITGLLDLLAGRYPSERFAELRPRIVWDRAADVVTARPGAQRLAVTNPGTIPDRGLFGVFLPDGTRVGELDEEMVYESRTGETFLLGATTWRIEDITFERVVVTPAPGQPGKMPFWHGDGPGRPVELGRAVGALVRDLRNGSAEEARARLMDRIGLDRWAAGNLVRYLDEQADATGAVPDDRTIVVERFRDEIGDWRVCVLSPFGARVHAPWAMALRHRLRDAWGVEVELLWSDDGIVVRLPEAVDELPLDVLAVEPELVDDIVVAELPGTALFAGAFRECAARALLLPRRRPDRRTPLWQQRQRAADLLAAASEHPTFPILLEATRECLNDVFDLPALRQLLADIRSRRVRLVPVDTATASPFASSLLFGWIAVYMYEGDAPLAERRAAALALDRELLRDLLGAEELRELIDPDALAQLEAELQWLAPGRQARRAEDLWDLLRRLGPLDRSEIAARAAGDAAAWTDELLEQRRIIEASVAGHAQLAAAEDAGRLRDALGVALPLGLPAAFTESIDHPLDELVARYAHTHGPFTSAEPAARFGLPTARIVGSLEALEQQGRLTRGEFRPGGFEREWCDVEVLTAAAPPLTRRPAPRGRAGRRRRARPLPACLAGRRQLVARHGRPGRRARRPAGRGGAGIGARSRCPAARVRDYRPADLDALFTAGDLLWVGDGALGANDGRIRFAFRDQASLLLDRPSPADGAAEQTLDDAAGAALLEHLAQRGASFWAELVGALAARNLPYDDASTLAALWDLVWAGLVTNDSLAPLRAYLRGARSGVAGSSVAGSGASVPRRSAGGRSALGRNRPRPGRLSRIGPPAGAGRWSLVAPQLEPRPPPTEITTARAFQLLERYGVLTRETALAEGIEGGFAGVYPVLKALEERGQVRRGYFVAGLGAAQFALPGAVDRLRAYRPRPNGAAQVAPPAESPDDVWLHGAPDDTSTAPRWTT